MYKRLTLCVGALTLLLHSATVFADDAPQVFVCTSAEYAATGAAAMKSIFLLDGSAIETTTTLKKKKQCWFEAVDIPKKYTTLSRLYIEEGSANAYVIVPLQIRGVKRYLVFFEEGGPTVDA